MDPKVLSADSLIELSERWTVMNYQGRYILHSEEMKEPRQQQNSEKKQEALRRVWLNKTTQFVPACSQGPTSGDDDLLMTSECKSESLSGHNVLFCSQTV